jgi:hypothetical protein
VSSLDWHGLPLAAVIILIFLLTRSRRSDRICGWIVMKESATYMKFTQVGADLFA